jgi:hypothetical protein
MRYEASRGNVFRRAEAQHGHTVTAAARLSLIVPNYSQLEALDAISFAALPLPAFVRVTVSAAACCAGTQCDTAARLAFSARHARVASAATANVVSDRLSLCFRFLSPCSRMSSDTFWSDACRNARQRPLPTLLVALYASCGATVRRPPLLPLGSCPAHVCVAGCLVCV